MLVNQNKLKETVELTEYSKLNQVGIDLSVNKIEKIMGGIMVYKEKTVVKPESFIEIKPQNIEGRKMWRLEPGPYTVTFNEKVSIPANSTGFIVSRSSIYRGGSSINSPIWDPGFTTGDNTMGTTIIVNAVIFIEENARIGQFYMIESPVPDELYCGQFQNKTNY